MNDQLELARKYRKRAVLWITVPYILLIVLLMLYAISGFALNLMIDASQAQAQTRPAETSIQLGDPSVESSDEYELPPVIQRQGVGLGQPSALSNAYGVFSTILSLLSTIAVILIPVGLILGVVNASKARKVQVDNFDQRSGKGPASEIPQEIKGWSWGAAGLNIIWGAYHSTWISFLILVPYLNLIFWIVLGLKGREWAWRNMRWENVEDFKKVQKKWDIWGLIIFILTIIAPALLFGLLWAGLV